jgi:hypothetical protein
MQMQFIDPQWQFFGGDDREDEVSNFFIRTFPTNLFGFEFQASPSFGIASPTSVLNPAVGANGFQVILEAATADATPPDLDFGVWTLHAVVGVGFPMLNIETGTRHVDALLTVFDRGANRPPGFPPKPEPPTYALIALGLFAYALYGRAQRT